MTKRGFEVAKGFEDKGINLPKRGTANAAGYDFEAAEDVVIPSLAALHKDYKDGTFKIMTKELFGIELTEEQVKNGDIYFDDMNSDMILSIQSKLSTLFKALDIDSTILEDIDFPQSFNINNLTPKYFKTEEELAQIVSTMLSQETVGKVKDLAKKTFKPVLVPTGVKAYMGEDEVLILANRSSNPLKQNLILSNGIGVIDSDYYGNEDNDGHIMGQFINFGPNPVFIKKGDRIFQGMFQPFLLADNDVAGGKRVGGHGSTGLN